MNVHDYFTQCEKQMPEKRAFLRRTSFALRRGGVDTMEKLCDLHQKAPEKLADVRDIGPRILAMIDEVIVLYENQN